MFRQGDRVKIVRVGSKYFGFIGSVSCISAGCVGVYIDRDQLPIDALSHIYYRPDDIKLIDDETKEGY